MDDIWKTSLWRQFNASITMLENAIRACPDDAWHAQLWPMDAGEPQALSEFWYVTYHTLFWLDLYLTGAVEGFAPPPPFNLDELDPAGLVPDPPCPPELLLAYLDHCRQKCQVILTGLTDEQAHRICTFRWGSLPFAELLLDNLRHVQEHAAQLNLLLGQKGGQSKGWAATSPVEPG